MERRLAAILASDVVGYTKLMGRDEVGTHETLKSVRTEVIEPKTSQYHGRRINLIGDGELIEFPSIVEALSFAVEMQILVRRRNKGKPGNKQIQFRIGINIGDVIIEDDDIYGDGVNLAARMESIAEPGGICLSKSARDQVRANLDLDLENLGFMQLKNISRPVQAYKIIFNKKTDKLVTPISKLKPRQEDSRQEVILIFHGIRSASDWQTWIRDQIAAEKGTHVQTIGFGAWDTFQFIVPGRSPRKQLRQVRQELLSARRDYPEHTCSLSIIAHGFGTFAVTQVLKENPYLTIDNLLLCGSVVHPEFEWDQVDAQIRGHILNECATSDSWPVVVKAFNWRYGSTGTYGFNTVTVVDRFHAIRHREMFNRDFVSKYWQPFVNNSRIVKEDTAPERFRHPPYFWLLGNPLKVFVSSIAVLTLFLFVGLVQFLASENRVTKNNILCLFSGFLDTEPGSVKIGAVMPLDKEFGKRHLWGIERYLRDSRGKYSFTPELLVGDSKGNKDDLDLVLEKYKTDKVVAVVGPMQSQLAYYGKLWGNRHQVPVVTSNATASYLTHEGQADYFFRVAMSDGARTKAVADWIIKSGFHRKKPYIVHEWAPSKPDSSDPEIYGASQATAVKRHLTDVTTLRFTRGDKQSQDKVVQQISNDENRAIAIFGYTSDIIYIINKLQAMGVKNQIFLTGVVNKRIENANFPYAQNIRVVTGLISEVRNPTNSPRLRQDFEDDNPDIAYDVSTYYAYDATSMVLEAIQKTVNESCFGNAEGKFVVKHLRQTPENTQRKVVTGGFLENKQEVFVRIDGLIIDENGKLAHVGVGGD